jgi:CPA1 family monovalent cation:H+ antiporter
VDTAYTLIAMLLAVALVGWLARLVSTPYPILLVAAGLCIAYVPGLNPPPLDPSLILVFFLPPLLYKEAFHTSWIDFARWIRPITMLAVGLVAATMLAVGLVAKWLMPELPWAVAFTLGAIVSPTDTVAANAVLHRLRIPRRLSTILGGESLVNDATGLVAFQLAIGVVLSGAFHWLDVGLDFLWTVVGGVGFGLLVGAVVNLANRMIRDTTVLFAISLAAPFVAFAAAHVMHASGVLAVVVAGFYVSWRIHRVAADTRYQLYTVWRLLSYVIDAFCFLLIGIEIPRLIRSIEPERLPTLLTAGAIVTLTVIVVRILWVYPSAYISLGLFPSLRRREGGYPPKRNLFLASWCGMRGAVSLAAALAVPLVANSEPFPGREELIVCTFCVILGTLIVQGLTLQPVICWLGVRDDSNMHEEERLARVSMIEAALSRLDALRATGGIDADGLRHVETTYLERLGVLIDGAAPLSPSTRTGTARSNLFEVELEALRAERRRLLGLRDTADINDLTHDGLQEELDIAEMRLRDQSSAATPH